MKTLLILVLLAGCASAPQPKPILFLSVGSCWYQLADKKAEVCVDTVCTEYISKAGDWEARCQEDQLERYKREGCSFRRMSPGVVAVACK